MGISNVGVMIITPSENLFFSNFYTTRYTFYSVE